MQATLRDGAGTVSNLLSSQTDQLDWELTRDVMLNRIGLGWRRSFRLC